MLVLSRKEDEEIYIGDDVVIRVEFVGGRRVRLNVYAPRDVRINRGEHISQVDQYRIKRDLSEGRMLRGRTPNDARGDQPAPERLPDPGQD